MKQSSQRGNVLLGYIRRHPNALLCLSVGMLLVSGCTRSSSEPHPSPSGALTASSNLPSFCYKAPDASAEQTPWLASVSHFVDGVATIQGLRGQLGGQAEAAEWGKVRTDLDEKMSLYARPHQDWRLAVDVGQGDNPDEATRVAIDLEAKGSEWLQLPLDTVPAYSSYLNEGQAGVAAIRAVVPNKACANVG